MSLPIGWAETLGKGLASKDEQERAAAMGVDPRRCFRINRAAQKESAARGGILGHKSRGYRTAKEAK